MSKSLVRTFFVLLGVALVALLAFLGFKYFTKNRHVKDSSAGTV